MHTICGWHLNILGELLKFINYTEKKNLELAWLLLNLVNIMQHVVGSTLYLDITHHSLSEILKKISQKNNIKKQRKRNME